MISYKYIIVLSNIMLYIKKIKVTVLNEHWSVVTFSNVQRKLTYINLTLPITIQIST